MKINNYKSLVYEEDERKINPAAFHNNGTGNRRTQHVTITKKEQVAAFLEKCGLTAIMNDRVCLSLLWRFPRKEYSEKEDDLFVHMSGFTCSNNPPFKPQTFVIADYVVTEEAQQKARDIIDMLNGWKGIEVSYQED